MLLVGGKHAVTAFAVVRKAAGRKQDASPRPHLRFSVRASQHGATHGASHLSQPHCRRRGAQLDAEIGGRAQQPSNQGQSVAQLHATPVQGEIDQVPPKSMRNMEKGARRPGHVHKRCEVRPGLYGHAHERGLAHGLAQTLDEAAQRTCVVRRRDNRSAPSAGPGSVAVRVWDLQPWLELNRGVLLEEGHHMRGGLKEGVHLGFVEVVAEHVAQIGAWGFRILDDAGSLS
jgi:hypothetical protein